MTKCATCSAGNRAVKDGDRWIHLYADGDFLGPCFDPPPTDIVGEAGVMALFRKVDIAHGGPPVSFDTVSLTGGAWHVLREAIGRLEAEREKALDDLDRARLLLRKLRASDMTSGYFRGEIDDLLGRDR